jgi:ABC-2 type transport system ATP-binding protein
MSYAVRTEELGRRFGATEALSGLDLAVEPGSVLGLLGHNGAGKTTAVRILTTLLSPTTGRAFVAGRDVVREPHAVREQIAVAGQEASLDERLTGRENLMLIGRLQKLSKRDAVKRTGELLERFGIAAAADRLLGTYSGGMRRRLDLAACLMVRRPVVFLDEPTTGLDPASRAEMWESIAGLVSDGAALILTTQYLEEADRLADRIVVLRGGRTVAQGTPTELKRRVGDRRVHVTLADAADFEAAARRLERREPELEPRIGRLSIAAPGGPDDLRAVLDLLDDVDVEEASLSQPTLDDAFFALAGEKVS